ncbi:hypothetical protein SKAU_G00314100 [Synaphobranchus kaupii]|uniref:Uncharacterized protein n=1 Tax=Synaphobranchus kaupii TaxID=118154 RepID=A0A9Q1IKK8_SYNKA|nr:hypothetical protein SKAU_G00314100 [Synaphobranchus kaupii]
MRRNTAGIKGRMTPWGVLFKRPRIISGGGFSGLSEPRARPGAASASYSSFYRLGLVLSLSNGLPGLADF